jgi:D-3-phosphoglycerate dehydrogenase / 2-oxoglutarate reductase
MPNVLIMPSALFGVTGPHVEILHKAGFEVHYPDRGDLTGETETILALRGVAATIAAGEPYTERVVSNLPDLRVISRWGVGVDRIDLDAVTRRGVAVTITPASNHEAVAEHTLALLLALSRSIVRQNREVRQGSWNKTPLLPLRGRALGLIGLGRIGRSVALRAAQFQMRLLAFDSAPDPEFARTSTIELVDLDTLLAQADYVSLHLPLTPSSIGLINRETLSRMKPGSFLLNTSRGGLVVEEDLVSALQSGHLAGAGLDVFRQEPPSIENPLLQLENVVVTAHMAGVDIQSSIDMAVKAAQNIIDLYQGLWPQDSIVNSAVRQSWRS